MKFYSRATLNDIEDLEDSSKLFEILTEKSYRGDYPYWTDIWNGIKYYNKYNDKYNFLYVYDEKKLKELEGFGLNYNYRDNGGQNFLQYVLGNNQNHSSDDKSPRFMSKALDYIISKTDDVCKPNAFNRNILFNLLSYSAAGLDGKNFFKFINDYPDLDIHIVDKSGKNLMFEALLKPAQFCIINYLIENKVSLTQIDDDGHTLLHVFFSFGKSKESLNLFNTLFESIKDISQKDKYGDSFIDLFITFTVDERTNHDSRERYNYWLQQSLKKISNGEFKKTEQCIKNMIDILENHSESYKMHSSNKDALAYERALKSLNYFLLDMTINIEDNNKPGKKLKI